MIHYHKTRQNTDRIARKVGIYRGFLRSVFGVVYRLLVTHYRPPR
jgi:hypothetical protein